MTHLHAVDAVDAVDPRTSHRAELRSRATAIAIGALLAIAAAIPFATTLQR